MSRLIKWIGIPVVAVALLAVSDASKADAGNGFALRVGGFGISTGHHHVHRPIYHRPVVRYPSFYRPFGRPIYFHDTTHLDYHAPQLVPHNGHLDLVPGHYDVHRTGHWHH